AERPRRSWVRGAAAAALVAAAAWTFHDLSWARVIGALATARPGWIALAPAATFAAAFKSMVVGFASSTVLPVRAGELARMHFLSRRTGLPQATVLSSIALDYLVNAAGLLLGVALL